MNTKGNLKKNLKKNTAAIVTALCLLTIGGCSTLKQVTHPDRGSLTTSKVHLVDTYTHDKANNFLFRGADPVLESKEFAYDELVTLMKKAATEAGAVLPDDFYLIDVSLLFVERADLSVERKYFDQNSDKGEFINHPVFGHIGGSRFERITRISDKSAGFLAHFSSYPVFGILEKLFSGIELGEKSLTHLDVNAVHSLRGLLTQSRSKPTVVYVHCVAGCDRTGEIVGGYRMQYKKQGVQAVYDQNTKECGREEYRASANALEAFCRYLGNSDCKVKT